MDFPAEFSISVSCLPAGRSADHSACAPRTTASLFSGAEGGFHQALWFPPHIVCRNWEKKGLFMMNSYNTDLWVEMSLLPLNTWLSCSCCSPGPGCAASYKVKIFWLPGYSYPVYFLLKLITDLLELGKCPKVIEPSHSTTKSCPWQCMVEENRKGGEALP